MFTWVLEKLEKAGRKYVIFDNGSPYLTRYYLVFKDRIAGERTDIPGNVFLHNFLKSDSPVYHDHPFSYVTVVLRGGYWEHKPDLNGNDVRTWRGPGSVVRSFKSSETALSSGGVIPSNAHWIELPEGKDAWTLFFRGRKVNDELGRDDWGFYPDIFKPRVWWKDWVDKQKV